MINKNDFSQTVITVGQSIGLYIIL